MKTLLVVTTGRTDVQLVINNVRRELDGKTCGLLHTELERRGYTIKYAPAEKEKPPLDTLPEGELSVCAPKLDAVLAHFGDTAPANAVIFETRRTLKDDPHLAGTVLEKRLQNHGVQVRRHAFLLGEDTFDDSKTPEDAVVRRSVVADLSKVIAEEISKQQPISIVLATTGGPPPVTDVINELVRLHTVGCAQVFSLEVPESKSVAVEEKFHPAAGYRARWHALSLAETGNLLGAWGAVSHLKGAPGQEWTEVVEWLAHFASSLPLPPSYDLAARDLAVLSHSRMAVRAALRVELALRAGDIPRAVHGTVAFFEAALWDKLGERIERSADPEKRRFFKVKSGDAPTGDKLLRKGDGSDKDRKRPFELKETVDGVAWYWVYDNDGGPAARLAKYFLQCDALTAFDKALGCRIRELRNDVAHNEPTQGLMEDARRRMRDAQLWSSNDTILSQPLVQDVLREIGEPEPGKLLETLLADVRRRLVNPATPVGAT